MTFIHGFLVVVGAIAAFFLAIVILGALLVLILEFLQDKDISLGDAVLGGAGMMFLIAAVLFAAFH